MKIYSTNTNGKHFVRSVFFMMFLLFFTGESFSQFYNGSQLTFGKKRVQYNNFFWTYYRYDRFDTYFYLNGKELAIYTAEYADKHIREIELELQSNLEEKVQFIIFNNLSDLKQSNIGLSGDWDTYNTGGVTRIVGGRVLLYFDGDYAHFEQQIRAGIAMVLLNEMVYGAGIGSQVKNNALFTMPEWYLNGLISYISRKWDPSIDNMVRDAILSGKFRKFNRLTGLEAANAGHSLWNFIASKYGATSIPNIVYMARLNRNVERGFLDVIGVSYKDLMEDWLTYYHGIYSKEDSTRTAPSGKLVIKKPRKDRVYRQLKISPDDSKAAYCTFELGIYKVFLKDLEKGKTRKIFRGGYRLDEKPDFSYPVLAWHPNGSVLAILTEKKGEEYLYFYSLDEKKKSYQVLFDFDKILDISYSDDGALLLFSAVRKGQSDIYIFNIASGSYEQITRDIYNDLNPRFINHSKEIIFSSNRVNDTIKFDPEVDITHLQFSNDLFVYDYAGKKSLLRRITRTPNVNELQPMPYSGKYFSFLGDNNGIFNRYLARFDSAIAYIDTATHYRYYTTAFPVTNYSRNILEQEIAPYSQKTAEVVFRNNRYEMDISDRIPVSDARSSSLQNSTFKDYQNKEYSGSEKGTGDTTARSGETEVHRKHFVTVMRSEKPPVTEPEGGVVIRVPREFFLRDSILSMMRDTSMMKGMSKSAADSAKKFENAKILNYNVEYSIDQLVTQIDFNYLNTAYQPFTGAKVPIFINPGLNALLMVGITDLMEDYKLIGGIRLNFNFINNEYLFSYLNQHKRLDHQIIFHRQSVQENGLFSIIRHRIHELYYIATYPFTPVLYISGTGTIRYDRAVYLSTDQGNLKTPDQNKVWGSLKGELTYDNTRNLGLNLYEGTRYKIFGEYYNLFNNLKNSMVVLGADFRNYRRIHRTMILALRFAASTSFGNNKLIYYMGGVDNWLVPSFDDRTSVATDQNYAFQTLATNMRGFKQNIRNGNSFALINTEIRIPVFRYLFNRPIRSDLLNNFQAVAFGDAGTAWTGVNPYSTENQLFITNIENNPIFARVEILKEPIVEGFGFGLRTRLFGYFIRGDMAWGVEDGIVKKPLFYFSLSLDF